MLYKTVLIFCCGCRCRDEILCDDSYESSWAIRCRNRVYLSWLFLNEVYELSEKVLQWKHVPSHTHLIIDTVPAFCSFLHKRRFWLLSAIFEPSLDFTNRPTKLFWQTFNSLGIGRLSDCLIYLLTECVWNKRYTFVYYAKKSSKGRGNKPNRENKTRFHVNVHK